MRMYLGMLLWYMDVTGTPHYLAYLYTPLYAGAMPA